MIDAFHLIVIIYDLVQSALDSIFLCRIIAEAILLRFHDSHGGLRALYDNCGEDEQLAIRLHKAVMTSKMDGFRNNPVKETRIKRELYKILKDEDMVECLYKIVVEQEEY